MASPGSPGGEGPGVSGVVAFWADVRPSGGGAVSGAGPGRAATLIAQAAPQAPGQFRFDIHLQGEHETVFFDV